ncbi:thiamine phosphate synthase [Ciceribacter sp. L1K23]|uniref:thiamine phosphate synthase n=1 Tax=Ciceribacter sp. L1K23 TaxID=2820276 RepID=UPI001B81AEEE|nr:thiamine phosphate synthase [Ciceribacter sp. L1K23]MBR0557288.1 thiamine phosphate synthase [Ciceribacter sp. L1K23]
MRTFDLSLYLVLDPVLCAGIGMVETARLAVAGGVTMVQLRNKHASTDDLVETGLALKAVLAGTGVPIIVNDDVEAAMIMGAAGIHVGQGDAPVAEVRERIGHEMILGLSIGSISEAARIDTAVVDYVGVGPVFPTATKPGHPPAIGFAGLADVASASPVPSVAIGGLKRPHVADCRRSGASGVAVVSAICGQVDPSAAAAELVSAWKGVGA